MKELVIGIRNTITLWVLTAVVYPAFVLLVAQVAFPYQANGSLIESDRSQIIGSAIIGQTFTSAKYFRSRPSVVNYSEGAEAEPTGLSGASNFAPSNPQLANRIETTVRELQAARIKPTPDLVYTSGSGLDPHISPEAARAQISRIAAVRSLDPKQLEQLITQYTERRFLGIFGEPGVNVLKLNLALNSLEVN